MKNVATIPLAEQLRPDSLDGFIGQEHLVGSGAILRKAIDSGTIPSMILWGPPGVGKTTLAFIISKQLNKPFFSLSAINSGVKEIREVISTAKENHGNAILFIDEIHRFSKSQQDSLLGAVEKGIITLIGATTENPSFEVISPLISRCQVYILKSLNKANLVKLTTLAIEHLRITTGKVIEIKENEALLRISGGDARKLLNAIDLIVASEPKDAGNIVINNQKVQFVIQQNLAIYDKGGEMHYDVISAFIKSIRGSDPNAAVYWLARMIIAGEDPLFIARRMLILASEDIGNANPNALLLANNCYQAVHSTGYPECRLMLSQTAIYLACSPKSNASYMALNKAMKAVEKSGDPAVPLHLRNAPTQLMEEIGYGKGYKYSHDYDMNFYPQEYLPEGLEGMKFYDPQHNAREEELRKRLQTLWNKKYNY